MNLSMQDKPYSLLDNKVNRSLNFEVSNKELLNQHKMNIQPAGAVKQNAEDIVLK